MKSLVTERVFPDGVAVLNAEDGMTPTTWPSAPRPRIAYFSLDPQNERFEQHVRGGGLGAVMDRHDTLCLYRSTLRIPLVHARQVADHLRRQGALQHRERAGRGPRRLRGGDRARRHPGRPHHVPPDTFQAPGRANVYDFRDFRVMIDYCHNPHAMATVAPFLSAIKKNRIIAVMNTPGDRRDKDFEEMGRLAAPHFDHVILRDDEDLRGREPGEVAGKLRDALVKHGMKRESVETRAAARTTPCARRSPWPSATTWWSSSRTASRRSPPWSTSSGRRGRAAGGAGSETIGWTAGPSLLAARARPR